MPGPLSVAPRLLFALLVLALAVLTGMRAAGASIGRDSPAAALQLNQDDAVALVADADRKLIQSGATGIDGAAMLSAGRRTLQAAPLSAGGLRLLGMAAAVGGDRKRAHDLMVLATRVSRRDLFTHLWMIDERAEAGDIPGALDRYDLALSIRSGPAEMVFPVLTAALAQPDIRAAFSPMIGQNRPWMPDFLSHAIANTEAPQDIADMIIARGGFPSDAAYAPLQGQLLQALFAKQQYAALRRFALSLPGARPEMLNDVSFRDAAMDPKLVPITWQLPVQAGSGSTREEGERISVSVSPNTRSTAALRLLFLPRGKYELTYTVSPMPGAEPARLDWELRCPSHGLKVAWQESIPPPQSEIHRTSTVFIPAECEIQQLWLVAIGGDSQSEAGTLIGPVRIVSSHLP